MDKNIVIIGLPGSGKTTLMKRYKFHTCFDDFVSTLYNGDMFQALEHGLVCVCDPRLCNYELFQRYIELYFDKSNTKLILFENKPDICIHNIEMRNKKEPRPGLIKTIEYLASIYDINKYKGYEIEVLSVLDYSESCG